MNEIIIATISCIITCITTILCFFLKNKFLKEKNSKNFLDVISQDRVEEVTLYIKKSPTYSQDMSEFYKIEGSAGCNIRSGDLELQVKLKEGLEFEKKETLVIKNQLKNMKEILYV